MLGGKVARRRLKLRRAEIVGRRVDQVAAEIDRLGQGKNVVAISSLWKRKALRLGAVLGPVPPEAIGAEEPSDGCQLRIRQNRGETIVSRGQRIWQRAGKKGCFRGPVLPARAEQSAADGAGCVREQKNRAGGRPPAALLDPFPLGRAQTDEGVVTEGGKEPDRPRGGAPLEEQLAQF